MTVLDKLMAPLKALARADGWENKITGLGTSVDKALYHRMYAELWLDEDELEGLYYGDAFARRIVTEPVKAALRPGWSLTAPSELDTETRQEQERRINALLDDVELVAKYKEARYWGRLYGQSALLLVVDDGRPMDKPLDLESVTQLVSVEPLESRELSVGASFYGNPLEPKYGQPEIWIVDKSTGGAQTMRLEVHETRLILMGGEVTSERKRIENGYRDASVLQASFPYLQSWSAGLAGAAHMMTDSSQAVLKIKNFVQMLASEDMSVFTTRMRILEFARSLHIMPVDADTEDFSYVERTFAGVADLLDRFGKALAGSAGMPLTLLMGQSPAGLNATGESDILQWDDQVLAEQTEIDGPNLERLVTIAAYATEATEPEAWGLEWLPLRSMTPTEQTDHRKKIADIDSVYIGQGVHTEDEIAIHRFGGDEYDDSPVMVDTEGREALAAMDLSRAAGGAAIEVDPSEGLNGAQSKQMQEIVMSVASGQIPRESGVAMLLAALPIAHEVAEAIMGKVGKGFVPTDDEPAGEVG